jgi:hypothetical protein
VDAVCLADVANNCGQVVFKLIIWIQANVARAKNRREPKIVGKPDPLASLKLKASGLGPSNSQNH